MQTNENTQNFSNLNEDLKILRKDITELKNITVEKKSLQGSTAYLMTQKNGLAIRKTG